MAAWRNKDFERYSYDGIYFSEKFYHQECWAHIATNLDRKGRKEIRLYQSQFLRTRMSREKNVLNLVGNWLVKTAKRIMFFPQPT